MSTPAPEPSSPRAWPSASASRPFDIESLFLIHVLPDNMAPTIANSGIAPTTLTLMPFHADSHPKKPQYYRLPRIAQQASTPAPTPYTRNSRTPYQTPSFSSSVSTLSSRNVRSIPNASSLTMAKPTVVSTRSPVRAPTTTTALTKVPDTYKPKSPSSMRNTRQPVTTVAKVHAIAPIGASSIDSILHAGSSQDTNKNAVPDRIRPKAEAIK